MSSQPHDPSAGDQHLDEIVTAYLKAVEAGETTDQQAWLTRYPELAEELAAFFAGQNQVERLAAPLRPAPATKPPLHEAATLSPSLTPSGARSTKIRYFGDYELLGEIARGGMGVVYRARQVSLNRIVALKMIITGQLASQEDVSRFHREAEAAANLDHPNIVPIYEVGEHEGQHYFSMKLVECGSLAGVVGSGGWGAGTKGGQQKAAELVATIARAVHHAHQRGILHRDLKPGNILIDAHGQPNVTDFGLARRVEGDPGHTRTGNIVGTPSYMPPEQARSEKMLTTGVDIYSLGAIFYELLTGRPPFRADTALDTLLQVLERDPEPPSRINATVDRDLEAICLRCLEKDPAKRYPSALALAEELDRWLAGQPIQARPSGPAKQALKWAKRKPALACLLAVSALWYFDVRLPWQWVWLEWAFYCVLVVQGLSRLTVVCGRAVGKFRSTPLNLSLDGFLLPGVALAVLVLCFYHGDLADRKSLAASIILVAFYWGSVIQWLWRRMQADDLALALRTPLAVVCVLAGAVGLVVIQEAYQLFSESGQTGDLLANVLARIQIMSGAIWLLLLLSVGIEIRRKGCVIFSRYIRWEEIESYDWRQTKNALFLRLKLHNNPLVLEKLVYPPKKKELVDRILPTHVPLIGQDIIVAAAPSQVVDGSAPTQQVRHPAALLLLSGIIQFFTSLFLAVLGLEMIENRQFDQGTWEMWKFIGLVIVLLSVLGVLSGIVVLIGSQLMRNLKTYRFCRLSCILAMAPLGLGFVVGLPCGIWALRVLSRPEVKAAFLRKR